MFLSARREITDGGAVELGRLQPSARVVAGGRFLLACLFLFAIVVDRTQPTRAPMATYSLLVAYVSWSAALAALTWRNWWLDARLTVPALIVDIAVFMAMLYATEGYSSPYFIFFVFLLLSAAIRGGWLETTLTAVTVIVFYMLITAVAVPAEAIDVERFLVRTGHIVILSAILIWFGASRRNGGMERSGSQFDQQIMGGDPFSSALRAGMTIIGAHDGALLWYETGVSDGTLIRSGPDSMERVRILGSATQTRLESETLYDMHRQRALSYTDKRWSFGNAAQIFPEDFVRLGGLETGIAIPIETHGGTGIAFFQEVSNLSTDHLDIARMVGREMVSHLQAARVVAAAEETSMAKARVAVARDLHDSVVQFLAGLGFRLEALCRSSIDREEIGNRLGELKQLVLTEQAELREFIGALSASGSVPLADLERDVTALCQRLARQWNIDCNAQLIVDEVPIPARLHVDLQQLIREGVANAVRHGKASRVEVDVRADRTHLCLTIEDDGAGFASGRSRNNAPASLTGRVKEVGGELTVQSAPGRTSVYMRLPMAVSQ